MLFPPSGARAPVAEHDRDFRRWQMRSRAAITVNKPVDEIRRLWNDRSFRPAYIAETGATVTYKEAPGDRGTEIHVDLRRDQPLDRVGEAARKLLGAASLA